MTCCKLMPARQRLLAMRCMRCKVCCVAAQTAFTDVCTVTKHLICHEASGERQSPGASPAGKRLHDWVTSSQAAPHAMCCCVPLYLKRSNGWRAYIHLDAADSADLCCSMTRVQSCVQPQFAA